ncbi:MAG: bifunctional 5,10-methylenetetrahydrofolate dehydrogenase/5,10-methenyltetrahydrofolate cyclohydrolase [Elusimicrobia bacterium]|nr:bifunctional 5,10-methylenetetrahydrofolate dehydrogenase/5,10-methenyltetrahydrofolate cyclohydrolase [Elusimicrobiota bacterium]
MSARVLDGRALSKKITREARALSRSIKRRRGHAPCLAIVAAAHASARSYLQAKLRACAAAGVKASVRQLAAGPRARVLDRLARIAADPGVDAVLVESPYPAGLSTAEVAAVLPPGKDAEGLSPAIYGRLFLAKSWKEARGLIAPCTAAAVARLALAAKTPLAGRRAVVIGRSIVVGQPAAHLLSALDLTVTLAHHLTRGLPALCREADVLVAAAGRPGLVKPSWIKRGALVIDVGVSLAQGRLVGDVAPGAAARAAYLTPVPGGVGPVTTAVAVLQAARLAAAALNIQRRLHAPTNPAHRGLSKSNLRAFLFPS